MTFPPVLFARSPRPVRTLLAAIFATLAVALITFLISWTRLDTVVANIPMLYLLVVLLAALTFGRFAAVLVSIESFLAFDYYFVQPTQQFTVSDPSEWIVLCMFLVTATLVSQLTVLLVDRIEEREQSRKETEALAQASYAVTSQLDLIKALDSVLIQLSKVIALSSAAFIIIQEDGRLNVSRTFGDKETPAASENSKSDAKSDSKSERTVTASVDEGAPDPVAFVIAEKKAIGMSQDDHFRRAIRAGAIYQPVIVEERVLGVLHLETGASLLSDGEKRVIVSLSNLAGMIVQRDRLMKIEAQTEAIVKTERLKSALLSMVSHDFRSPLTSIKTSVNSLLSTGQPVSGEVQRRLLSAVDHETDRLNHLIDNILDLSCLEAGVLSLKLEQTPLAELVEAALNLLNEEENDRIVVKLEAESDEVNVDCVLMAQVLRNLLENALKYSPAEAKVELETFAEENRFYIEIKDRGRGLPKSEESLVFTPFFRASEVKETSIPGMGLGLALSKGLVEAHQGTLSAYNREAGGAVFRITLPLSSGNENDDESFNH
jgi:two-component system, OmpR family, sensor histidine kinase KdpD